MEIKGTFHARMVTINDKSSKDLTEAEEIKKRRQEYTELYKKGLHDLDNQDGVVTHLELDILKCEVKWVFGSNTTKQQQQNNSVSDGIPAKLFQILKDAAAKVLHSICQHIWKTQQWPQDWKRSVFISMPKNVHTRQLHSFHMIARLYSKSLKLGFRST